MKLLALSLLIGVCLGRPQTPNAEGEGRPFIGLLRSESEGPNVDGSYNFNFESADGIYRKEEGSLNDDNALSVSGSYSFTAPDGTYVSVKYVADEKGYRPIVIVTDPDDITGDRLPPPKFGVGRK